MNKENLIFADAEEKFLVGVMAYGHSDNKLYVDVAHKVAMTNDEAVNLFNKGLLLITDGTSTYKPVSIKKNLKVFDVVVVTGTGSTATFKSYSSSEPVAE